MSPYIVSFLTAFPATSKRTSIMTVVKYVYPCDLISNTSDSQLCYCWCLLSLFSSDFFDASFVLTECTFEFNSVSLLGLLINSSSCWFSHISLFLLRDLEKLSVERALEVCRQSVLRCFPHKCFSLTTLTGASDSKVSRTKLWSVSPAREL